MSIQVLFNHLSSQCSQVMARPVVETPLQSFFNFSGLGSGLFLPPIAWPFQSACQMLLWFRVEDFSSCKLNINDVSSPLCVPSISSFVTGDGIGIEYLLEDRSLCAKTVITRTKGTGMITTKTVLMRSTILEKNRCYSLVLQVCLAQAHVYAPLIYLFDFVLAF